MNLLHLTSAESSDKLRDARGAKRKRILRELQHRYDQTGSTFIIPRYDFALHHSVST